MRFILFSCALLIIVINSTAQITTAENGLYTPNATTVRLGGTLLETTNIDLGSSFDLHILRAGTKYLTILNNGNIGIGNSNPQARLSFTDANLTTDNTGMTWSSQEPLSYGIYRMAGPWSGPDYQQMRINWITGIVLDPGTSYGKSYVNVAGNGLRVSSGNVGIGTTNPGIYALAIEKNGDGTTVASAISLKNTNPTRPTGNTNNTTGVDFFAGNGAVIGQCVANYGVGASAPWNIGNGFYVITRTNDPVIFATGAVERSRITANGNFLVGTAVDNNNQFQVAGNASFHGPIGTGAYVQTGDNTINNVAAIHSYGDASGTDRYTVFGHNMPESGTLYNSAKEGGGVYLDDRSGVIPIRFMVRQPGVSGASFAAGVTATGNFVIGSPTDVGTRLMVDGETYTRGVRMDANNYLYWGDPNTSITRAGDVLQLREYTGQINLTGIANLDVAFTHPTNGNVDFSFPSFRVFALRNKEAYVLQTSAANQNECWIKLGASGPHYADGPGTRLYLFGGKGGDRIPLNGGDVFIDGGEKGGDAAKDGNVLIASQHGIVGIGTTNLNDAGYKLFVEGKIRTRKIRVDNDSWPDYVFDNNYQLTPLNEVEQYIQQQKHLPDVPSAAEVKKEGVDLSDNQAVLLKKIEELTLYVIQQQKQLEAQQKKIDMLEKKVAGQK